MTERGFWNFMEAKWKKEGRTLQGSCVIDNSNPEIHALGQYIGSGHALLPKNYQDLSDYEIIGMGKLLFEKGVKIKTKEAVLILLAHQPSKTALGLLKRYCARPDSALVYYSQFAMDECEMWND